MTAACSVPVNWQAIAQGQNGLWMREIELWTIGIILSAIVYGGVLSLNLFYFPLLLKSSYDISRRMRIFLLIYTALMVVISTVYMITTSIVFESSMTRGENCNGIFVRGFCLTFASWGADGFMVGQIPSR